jgi:SAM-dependent methyltransferase
VLNCIYCQAVLKADGPGALACEKCSANFRRDPWGYFTLIQNSFEGAGTTEEYAKEQHNCGQKITDFLRRLIEQEACKNVLDVGCGVGVSTANLASLGFNAWGVDLPNITRLWAAVGRDPDRFIAASALRLPFSDETFEFVCSLGVIEHIGTISGHCALAPNYEEQRKQYAKELVRITKPGGRILIACPSKSFPVDIQHGPGDIIEPAGRIRAFIFRRTGMNLHRTWGRYHLPSYGEVKNLFKSAGAQEFSSLPLNGYFEFSRFKSGFLRPFATLAEFWISNLPAGFRATFLNPYVMLQIRK